MAIPPNVNSPDMIMEEIHPAFRYAVAIPSSSGFKEIRKFIQVTRMQEEF